MLRAPLILASLLSAVPGMSLAQSRNENVRYSFGNIQVKQSNQHGRNGQTYSSHMILRDQINFGFCFEDEKYRRLPTTYYHPRGPLGMAMQRFNWLPGEANTYHADVRLPASLVLAGFVGLEGAALSQLVTLWSEPAVAVIGMEAGTVASYARPMQHFHFYEQAKEVIDLHERKGKDRFFHFIPDAIDRGAFVRIVHGSPREQLTKRGPRGFYQLMVLEACTGENGEKIFLDLFTKEGIAQCMEHLAHDGVLCVHTSHRFLDLPPVLARIAAVLDLQIRVGHDMDYSGRDNADIAEIGRFTSEWVLLARRPQVLDTHCKTPKDYNERRKDRFGAEEFWSEPRLAKHLWTDKGPNLLHGILRNHPFAMRYSAVAQPTVDFICDRLDDIGVSQSSTPFRIISRLGQLPHPIEQWMVQNQLRTNPDVEKLWP